MSIVVTYYYLTSTSMQIARESHIKVVLESESKVTSTLSSSLGLSILFFERKSQTAD